MPARSQQAARNGWLSWPQWLQTYTEFQRLFGFEGQPELRSQAAFEVVLEYLTRLVAADVLVLDDLLPPGGTLSEYQASTLNVGSGEEASRGMGVQVADRLRHGRLRSSAVGPHIERPSRDSAARLAVFILHRAEPGRGQKITATRYNGPRDSKCRSIV